MRKSLTIFIFLYSAFAFGQKESTSTKVNEWKTFRTFGFELGGDEGLYSVTYEGKFYSKNYHAYTYRGGLEVLPGQILPMAGVNYLFGKQKIHLQCGVHGILNFVFKPSKYNDFFTSFSIGPRFRIGKVMFIGLKYNYLFFPSHVHDSRNWAGLTWTFPIPIP